MKENKSLEFKEKVTNTFLKTVSAFSNFGGGKIIFGINDDGIAVGLPNIRKACLDIENKINDSIEPKPDYSISVAEATGLILLEVKEGAYKPYLYKGKAYRRSDTSSVEVDQVELRRLVLEGENLYYEDLPIEDDKLNFTYLFKALGEKLDIKGPSSDILKSLGLIRSDGKYNKAASVLADKNDCPGIDIFKFGSSINEIMYREKIERVSILELLERAEEAFNKYYRYEEIGGMTREVKYLVPREAFRETVANALVHRARDIRANIRIGMYEDRIEVYSPGGLPPRLNEQEYLNGLISSPRNPIIANVFFRLGIIETFGTGIRRIRKAYAGLDQKPIFKVSENSIVTILPSKKKRQAMTGDEEIIFGHFEGGKVLSTGDLVELTSFGRDKILRILKGLIDKSYIERIGSGRGTKYKKI